MFVMTHLKIIPNSRKRSLWRRLAQTVCILARTTNNSCDAGDLALSYQNVFPCVAGAVLES